jgi:FMN phosphatase YigB (HAD superfamily)
MFHHAMRRSHIPDLKAHEVLHIGNHFHKDFLGARAAGMHAVLLSRYERTHTRTVALRLD